MKTIHLLAFSVAVLLSCQSKKPDNKPDISEALAEPEKMETTTLAAQLTDTQKADGWKLLFDGQTLTGWRTFKNKVNVSWDVRDGALHIIPFDNRKEAERVDLMTIDQYENFELSMEWKLAPQCNTGVIFRCTEEFDEPFWSGPEYQIIDDVGYPGKLKETNTLGGTFDMYVPSKQARKPVGEWNTSRLVVNKNHVEHWLNGSKVVEYEIGSADWKKRKSASKWNDAKGYGAAVKGFIDLQDHGDEAWFRTILIRVL